MIDIVIAVYKGQDYIAEQLNSIIQSVNASNLVSKIIISDDSKDNKTELVAEQILKKSNLKYKYIVNKSNHGPLGNFVNAMKYSTSDYIMFCDQDDYWLDFKILHSLEGIQELEAGNIDKPALFFTDNIVVDSELNEISHSFFNFQNIYPNWSSCFKKLLCQNVAPGCTMIFNKAALKLASPIPAKALMHDWWLILVCSAFGKVGYSEKPSMLYRQHNSNAVGAVKYNLVSSVLSIRTILKKSRNSFYDVQDQAGLFIDTYENNLKSSNGYYVKAKAVANFSRLTRFEQLISFCRADVTKAGVGRKIGLLLVILAFGIRK